MKAREARQSVSFPVRIRKDAGWTDACIRNVSSRGCMLQMDAPPPRGSFLEVRRGTVVIVGQVRWAESDRCGLRTQDRISAALLNAAYNNVDAARAGGAVPADRRASVRVLSPEEVAERSRMKSALFQRVVLITGVVVAALFLATLLFDVLNRPMAQIAARLG